MATVKPALHGKAVETETRTDQKVRKGLVFARRFTDGKTSAFDMVEWEKRTALIGNEKGTTIFRQEGVGIGVKIDLVRHRLIRRNSRRAVESSTTDRFPHMRHVRIRRPTPRASMG